MIGGLRVADTSAQTYALALHSTHEAAEKIAGIGAVLDGILPEQGYQDRFRKTLLVGAYHFPQVTPLAAANKWRVYFDSARELPIAVHTHSPQNPATLDRLEQVASQYGSRVVFGERLVGPAARNTWVYVLVASPQGIVQSAIQDFQEGVYTRLGIDLPRFQSFPAVQPGIDLTLERILRADPDMSIGTLDTPYIDKQHRQIPGGINFINGRAQFPPIPALDSFQNFPLRNQYLIELQFYLYVAPILWEAARAIVQHEWGIGGEDMVFFAHDWVGVPLYWAMQLANQHSSNPLNPKYKVYFAHEARIARMLVEGTMRDKYPILTAVCDPDGHDVSFYNYLSHLPESSTLAEAFPGSHGFNDIFFHVMNREAAQFDKVFAVGERVKHETALICRGIGRPPITLCPNGVPDLVGASASLQTILEANGRLKDMAQINIGFKPDYIFTSVNRCELSKGPWRNVGFFRTFAQNNPDAKALFIWLVRPRPVATQRQIESWAQAYHWPLSHQPRSQGGDLREDEVPLWEAIVSFNRQFSGRCHILYVNQFGWAPDSLGALDPAGTQFRDLRIGTDVELGLSIYEPFGIAPLEPFSSGAVCVLSDACGCALHLDSLAQKGVISSNGFVVGRFIGANQDIHPAQVSLKTLQHIEERVYSQMERDVSARLQIPRGVRFQDACQAMPHLSWMAVVNDYFLPGL